MGNNHETLGDEDGAKECKKGAKEMKDKKTRGISRTRRKYRKGFYKVHIEKKEFQRICRRENEATQTKNFLHVQ